MKKPLLSILLAVITVGAMAQVSHGGEPFGKTGTGSKTPVATATVAAPAQAQIDALVYESDHNGGYPKIAITQALNIGLNNGGTWQTLANGDKVWRLRVASADARGLIFSFDGFYLPAGSKMFIYSPDFKQVAGSFTQVNNHSSGLFSVGIIQGSEAIVEYYEPAAVTGQGQFNIAGIGYVFRMAHPAGEPVMRDFGDSDNCQVNVNCTPEGASWQDEKRGVCRILLKDGPSWGWCSGSLVNNTAQNCTPYVLTALHCGETASNADRNQWVFYFNYEATGCSNPGSEGALASQSMTGCTRIADSNDGGGDTGSDFQLVQIFGSIPGSYNVYYNGWNANTTASTGGVGIHHPSGDIKKISSYTTSLVSSQWNGNGLPSHWRVIWAATTNGHGVTEGGSSGSPVFNNAGLIVGTLTGGGSYCTATSQPDYYGKMSYHWDQNTTPGADDLSTYLDPTGSGVKILNGTYPPCSPTAPTCGFTASATSVTAGASIDFTDMSGGAPTSWNWNFGGGGTPATSTVQNPTGIIFNTPGTYTVTLTATNATGSCNTTQTITVNASTGCDTLNYVPPGTPALYGVTSPDWGFVSGWNSYGDRSKVEYIATHAPYTAVTSVLVFFAGVYDNNNNALVNFNVYNNAGTAGAPGAILRSVPIALEDIETALGPTRQGWIRVDFTGPVNVGAAPFYIGTNFQGFGAGDSIGVVTNSIGDAAVNTAWEQWNDNTWHTYTAAWGVNLNHYISPLMTDVPVTANMTPATATSVCAGSTITFNGASSVNETTYEWYINGGTPNTATSASVTSTFNTPGTYTVYLVANGSCNGSSVDSVVITVNPVPTFTTAVTNASCGTSNGSIVITAAGGSGYQYSINGGATFQPSNTFSSLAAGTYGIVVQVPSGCQAVGSVTITNTSSLTHVANTVNASCGINGSITIVATGGTGTLQYSINGGTTFQASNTFTGLVPGNYNVLVQDGAGCTSTSVAVVSNTASTITHTTTPTDPVCGAINGQIVINATGGTGTLQYSINGGTTFQASNTFTGLGAGTYNIVVSDGACTSTSTVSLSSAGGPTMGAITTAYASCNGLCDGSLTLSATGGTGTLQYSINGGSTFQASPLFTGVCAGTYNLEVEDASGCSATTTATVTEPAAIVQTITPVATTCGNSDGSITVSATGGGGSGYAYSIDGGTTFVSSGNFTALASGTYQVVSQDGAGCLSPVQTIAVGASTGIAVTSTSTSETCGSSNGAITLTATGGSGYQYSIDGGVTFQSTPTFTNLSAGTYNVVVTSATGTCTGNATVTVVNTGSAVSGTVNSTPSGGICIGQTAILSASGGTSYTWSTGSTSPSIAVNPTTTTTYTVIISNGVCTDVDTLVITVNPAPVTVITPVDPTICGGQSITITASGGTSYAWNTGATTATITVSPGATTIYSCVASNGSCADNTPENTQVIVTPGAVANANATPTTVALSTGGVVNFSSAGSTGTTYSWTFGDGGTSTLANPSHTYTALGTYNVILTATLGACTDTDTIQIIVSATPGFAEYELVNAVAVYPNPNDGAFTFEFHFNEATSLTLTVFNVIGEVIETRKFANASSLRETIDIRGVESGIYYVNVEAGGQRAVKRISIVR